MNKRLRFPTGIVDFRALREGNFEYIDKSHLITEFLERDGHQVVLVPRPRRFGKTINVTMLKWFFEKRTEDVWHLFEGLHVARAGEEVRRHYQKYPVIHLSFKGTKADTWEGCFSKVRDELQQMCKTHQAGLEEKLDVLDRSRLMTLVTGHADQVLCESALKHLTRWLYEVYGVRPMVFIDEYDAPIHAGYVQGYYDKVVSFFRSFLEAGLKDNVFLERAFLTGILRVSKESIFSGFNNPGVYSLLESEFNTCFGFTENEVRGLLDKAGLSDMMDAVRAYYDGYDFGGRSIYNPWSILEFLAGDTRKLRPYWMNTSQNDLTRNLLRKHAFAVERDIQTLMEGGKIEKRLNGAIVFPDLETDSDSLWSVLALTGYLKASVPERYRNEIEVMPYELSIPNEEVAYVYRETFRGWLKQGLRAQGGDVQKLTTALLQGDILAFQEQLNKLIQTIPSYHDLKGTYPEKFFHGMMIGLLATLVPDYEVRSNAESGEGRPDVLIRPRREGKVGVVMELKPAGKLAGRTLKQALALGHKQVHEKDYAARLRAEGLETIHSLVIACDGKKVIVESAVKPPKPPKKPAKKPTKKPAKKRGTGKKRA